MGNFTLTLFKPQSHPEQLIFGQMTCARELAATLKDKDSARKYRLAKDKKANHTNGTFGFAQHSSRPFLNRKKPFFCQRIDTVPA